jgi:hypothetical protein
MAVVRHSRSFRHVASIEPEHVTERKSEHLGSVGITYVEDIAVYHFSFTHALGKYLARGVEGFLTGLDVADQFDTLWVLDEIFITLDVKVVSRHSASLETLERRHLAEP